MVFQQLLNGSKQLYTLELYMHASSDLASNPDPPPKRKGGPCKNDILTLWASWIQLKAKSLKLLPRLQ